MQNWTWHFLVAPTHLVGLNLGRGTSSYGRGLLDKASAICVILKIIILIDAYPAYRLFSF